MFDLYLLPIHLRNGQEYSSLAGFQAFKAPRRCERSRVEDVLLVRLHLMGGELPGASEIEEILGELAQAYYSTRGPVTTGLRAAVEAANEALLVYNGRKRRGSEQSLGILNLAAMRHDFLYLAHSGPARTFLFTPSGLQDFYNPAASGRGLGLSQASAVTYFHTEIEPESIALFFMELPPSLTADTLSAGSRPSLNLLRRRLLSFPGVNFIAGAVQFKAGAAGEIHLLRPRPGPHDASGDTIPVVLSRPAAPQPEPVATVAPAVHAEPVQTTPPFTEPPEDVRAEQPDTLPEQAIAVNQAPVEIQEAVTVPNLPSTTALRGQEVHVPETAIIVPVPYERQRPLHPPALPPEDALAVRPEVDLPPFVVDEEASPRELLHRREQAAAERTETPRQAQRSVQKPANAPRSYIVNPAQRKQMASAWQKGKDSRQKISTGIKKMLARILPGASDQSPQLSTAAMLFIALAVPLVVVILATTVYTRSGRSQQHDLYLAQAQQLASQASSQTDPVIQRSNYEQAVQYLDQAESFSESEASQQLRQQVYQSLDVLDHITRLQFVPAYATGFAPSVHITQIAASDTDAYLLDSSQGRVLRLFLTGRGYDLDDEFVCDSASSQGMIGDLVDITVIPAGVTDGTIMGIDSEGGLIVCGQGIDPLISQLPQPAAGWGKIQAITLDQGSIYVLDSASNMVYIFWDYFTSNSSASPYFDLTGQETPPVLTNMVDLAVDSEELYLLDESGSMTTCHYGMIVGNESHCQSPAPYGDSRPGLQSQVLSFPNSRFVQMQLTHRIDPALYVMDAATPSIYRFSLKLNLDRQFRSSPYSTTELPETTAVTAFAVSAPSTMAPSEVVFLAFGHELFYADLR